MKYKSVLSFLTIFLVLITTITQNFNYKLDLNDNIIFEGYVETLQIIIILFCIFLTFLNRRKLRRVYKNVYFIRLYFFLYLLYEELSFLTYDFCTFCDGFNKQGELNIHNAYFFNQDLFYLPVVGSVSSTILINISAMFIISCGSFIPILKRLKGLFFELRFAFFGNIIFFERVIYYILLPTGIWGLNIKSLLYNEFSELIIYSVFLLDLICKNNLIKKTH